MPLNGYDLGRLGVLKEAASPLTGFDNVDRYLVDIVDVSGTVKEGGMRDIRLAVQKGQFTNEEISAMSVKMNELGLSAEYEAEMKNIDFGDYLRTFAGDAPEGMQNPHAHHILFKTGNGPKQQALVEKGQAILRKYGIDPVVGHENLVWAPNGIPGQHAGPALERVVNGLIEIDEYGGSYNDIMNFLKEMGEVASSR